MTMTNQPVTAGSLPCTAADWAAYYASLGFALVEIPPGGKYPAGKDWPGRAVTNSDTARHQWQQRPKNGMGAVLGRGARRLVSLDVDSVEHTAAVFDALGLDLEAIKAKALVVVGNPARFRLLFQAPEGLTLGRKALAWPKQTGGGKEVTVFELRGGDVQDVLPPTIHPDTGQPYRWERGPWEVEAFPILPAALRELWEQWESYKGEMAGLCPWGEGWKPAPTPRQAGGNLDVIGQFNAAYPVGAVLESHGYKPDRTGKRYLAPSSSSGLAGVTILDGKAYSHHGADPLADGHAHDAFSAFTILDHRGDMKAAVRAAAKGMGIELKKPDQQTATVSTLSVIPGGWQPQPEAPPESHSEDAERAVLGGLLLDNGGWSRAAPIVAAKDFYRADNRLIFEAVHALEIKGCPFDPVTLSEYLTDQGRLEDAGGLPYLARLARDTPSAANIEAYARIVRKHSLTRQRTAAWHQGDYDRIALLTDELARLEAGGGRPLFDMPKLEDTAAWFDSPPPPRRMLIEDYLPAEIEGMVSAPGGTGKGYLMTGLAVAVAGGLTFMRHRVRESGGVLILQAEDDADEINRRIAKAVEAVREDRLIDTDDLRRKLAQNLMARSVRGLDMRLVERDEAGNARQTGAVDKIIAQAQQFQKVRGVPLKLIVLDPFASFFGLEENSNGDANLFITAIRRITAETGAAVLFVHHSNKEGARSGELTQANSRGASALTDGVRWQLNLAVMTDKQADHYGIDRQEAGLFVQARVTKSNYTSPKGLQWLRRRPGGYLDPVVLEAAQDVEKEAKIERLGEQIVHKVACAAGREEEYSRRAFAEGFAKELGSNRRQVEEIIKGLVADGKLMDGAPKRARRGVTSVLRLPGGQSDLSVHEDGISVQQSVQNNPSNASKNEGGRIKASSGAGFIRPDGNPSKTDMDAGNAATARVLSVQSAPPYRGENPHWTDFRPGGGESGRTDNDTAPENQREGGGIQPPTDDEAGRVLVKWGGPDYRPRKLPKPGQPINWADWGGA